MAHCHFDIRQCLSSTQYAVYKEFAQKDLAILDVFHHNLEALKKNKLMNLLEEPLTTKILSASKWLRIVIQSDRELPLPVILLSNLNKKNFEQKAT